MTEYSVEAPKYFMALRPEFVIGVSGTLYLAIEHDPSGIPTRGIAIVARGGVAQGSMLPLKVANPPRAGFDRIVPPGSRIVIEV